MLFCYYLKVVSKMHYDYPFVKINDFLWVFIRTTNTELEVLYNFSKINIFDLVVVEDPQSTMINDGNESTQRHMLSTWKSFQWRTLLLSTKRPTQQAEADASNRSSTGGANTRKTWCNK